MITPNELREQFLKVYHESKNKILFVSSPARINIIGEHIDYNGGYVFPTAIDRYLYVAIRKRDDSKVFYKDLFYHDEYEFDINDDFSYNKDYHYGNILNGILTMMKRKGLKFPCGFELMIASNIPSAGGISSSAALECGFAWAINKLFTFNLSRKEAALMALQSEHEFMKVNCGVMDQYIISTGKAETAELLDCAKIEHEYVPLNLNDYQFIVMNTKKPRELIDSEYNTRRSQCEKGLEIVKNAGYDVPNLCALTESQLEEIISKGLISDEIILKRVRHAVTENARVLKLVDAFKANDLETAGKLLYASHESLKTDYEVSCAELDTLVDLAREQEGCIGARMTGAGFGGCAIAIVRNDKADVFMAKMQALYTKAIGHDGAFFSCKSGDGVKAFTV